MYGKNLTDNTLDELLATLDPAAKNWKYVEFRCMIQDILGNEVYKKHNSDKLGDRTIFYCITIPGENDWVRCSHGSNKDEFMTNSGHIHVSESTSGAQENNNSSRLSSSEKNDKLSLSLVNWSYPIPSDGRNKSCLIKVYDIKLVEWLRVNDIVQVGGHLEPNEFEDDAQLLTHKSSPRIADEENGNEARNDNSNLGVVNGVYGAIVDFQPATDFPHRLVPRVHVRTLKKLPHINPLLPEIISRDLIDIKAVKLARARLSTILTQLLGGDTLASEYLILSLISRIQRRKDLTTLGQFTIGLSGIKPQMKFLVEKLYEIISKITTHSHFIDMSIANLNTLSFTPTKDIDNNKMIAGTLQLPAGLYLVLNETALTEGQLNEQGTLNLNTLNQIIRWQRHNYDFKFHSVEIDTDLKVLVLSEGKSILSVPYNVQLEKNDVETIESMRQACDAVNEFLTEDLLKMFRYFITALRDVPDYDIPENVEKQIQDDFLMWRKEGDINSKPGFSADDLSSYMTLARYLTISRGETCLTLEIWKDTCQMEAARISRASRSK